MHDMCVGARQLMILSPDIPSVVACIHANFPLGYICFVVSLLVGKNGWPVQRQHLT